MMKCFKIKSYNINNRLDPLFYSNDILAIFSKSNFPKRYLCDIVKYFKTGFAAGKAEQSENQNDIIQIRPTNINENRQLIFQKNIYISRKTLPEKKQYLVQKREILFNNTNSQELVGKSVYFDLEGDFFCSNHITRMGVDEKIVNPIYLTYILNWMQENKVFYNTCTNWNNQSGINIELLKSYIVPLPSLNVQNEIVKIIQKAYTLKSQYEDEANDLLTTIDDIVLNGLGIKYSKNINYKFYSINAMGMKNSRIDSYYHQPKFEEVKENIINSKYKTVSLLTLLADVISGQRPQGGVSQIKEGIPSIGGEHILSDGSIETENLKYIPIDFHNAHLNSKVNVLDVLMVKDGATTGKIGIIPKNYPYNDANINEHVFILRTKPGVNPYYIFAYLKSEIGQIQIQREITGGTIMGIIKDSLKNILIPYEKTNFNIQDEIANEYISNINKAKQLQDKAIKEFKQAKIKIEKIILGEL